MTALACGAHPSACCGRPTTEEVERTADERVEPFTLTVLTMPEHANNVGGVFGGHILAWIDQAAAVASMRYGGGTCVTVAMDRIEFRKPVPVGSLVLAVARVVFVGRFSLSVQVEVLTEDLTTGRKTLATSAQLTFVDLTAKQAGIPLSPLSTIPECIRDVHERAAAAYHSRSR